MRRKAFAINVSCIFTIDAENGYFTCLHTYTGSLKTRKHMIKALKRNVNVFRKGNAW